MVRGVIMRIAIAFLVGLLVSLLVTPLTKKLSEKLNIFDQPDARKVHQGAMTRLGGLGIYCGFMVGLAVYGNFSRLILGLAISATIVMAVGLYDDIKNISPKMKLLGQIVAAVVFIAFGARLEYLTNPFSGDVITLGTWGLPIVLLWLVGISNAVNLVDGLDGLASGISGIAALSLAVVSLAKGFADSGAVSLILVGSIIGFLRFNFHPAQLFMGDCGALFLGFLLGALSLLGLSEGTTMIALFVPIMVLGVPILDTCFAIIRRYLQRKPIFEADKGHLHHQLMQRGLDHRDTVLLIYGFTFILGALAVLVTLLPSLYSMIVLAVFVICILLGAIKIGIFGNGRKQANNKN